MGRSQVSKSLTHRRIVEVAARLIRERGLERVGVADVMREAGLTVGGFYKHFASRDDLLVEALGAALADLDGTGPAGARSLAEALDRYLCETHRDAPGVGCALGALLGEAARGGEALRAVCTSGVERDAAVMAGLVGGATPAARRARALTVLASCIGAIGLARAASDPDLSREILRSVAQQMLVFAPAPE